MGINSPAGAFETESMVQSRAWSLEQSKKHKKWNPTVCNWARSSSITTPSVGEAIDCRSDFCDLDGLIVRVLEFEDAFLSWSDPLETFW